MAVSLVPCSKCGRVFDPVAEHCLLDRNTQTYTCSNCLGQGAVPVSRSVFTQPAAPAKKPRSKVGTYLRIGFGALMILCGIDTADGIMIVIGLLLLLWQFWPQVTKLFRKKQAEVQVQRQAEAYQAREANRQKICSHCGAAVTGTVCEYCGMPLDD